MRDFFEQIDQDVKTRQLDVSTALVRLEQHLSLAGSSRDVLWGVHLHLPQLMAALFLGGWPLTSTVDLQGWLMFLRPQGVLGAVLLEHSRDPGWSLEIAPALFPPASRPRLQNRLQGNGALRLNMFEYLAFSLWSSLFIAPSSPEQSADRTRQRTLQFVLQDFCPQEPRLDPAALRTFAAFHWPSNGMADTYGLLVQQYLDYLMPTTGHGGVWGVARGLLDASIAFALDLMLEMLFDRGSDLASSSSSSSSSYPSHSLSSPSSLSLQSSSSASIDAVRAMQVCVMHVARFQTQACELSVGSKIQRNAALDAKGRDVCHRLCVLSYQTLRTLLRDWPEDASLAAVVSLWQAWQALAAAASSDASRRSFSFAGLHILGGQLLSKCSQALSNFAQITDDVDWQRLEGQVSVLTQCCVQILQPMALHLAELQEGEELRAPAVCDEIASLEPESFRLRPLFLTDIPDSHPAFILETALSNIKALTVYPANGELRYKLDTCQSLLQKCFLVMPRPKPSMMLSSHSSTALSNVPSTTATSGSSRSSTRLDAKRTLLASPQLANNCGGGGWFVFTIGWLALLGLVMSKLWSYIFE